MIGRGPGSARSWELPMWAGGYSSVARLARSAIANASFLWPSLCLLAELPAPTLFTLFARLYMPQRKIGPNLLCFFAVAFSFSISFATGFSFQTQSEPLFRSARVCSSSLCATSNQSLGFHFTVPCFLEALSGKLGVRLERGWHQAPRRFSEASFGGSQSGMTKATPTYHTLKN